MAIHDHAGRDDGLATVVITILISVNHCHDHDCDSQKETAPFDHGPRSSGESANLGAQNCSCFLQGEILNENTVICFQQVFRIQHKNCRPVSVYAMLSKI